MVRRARGLTVVPRARAAALAMAVVCGFMLPAVVRAASAGDGEPDLQFTARIQDQSIQDALDAIALLASRQIEVMGPIEDRKVSVTLNNATLAESIDKVLSPSNYVIVWSDEKNLTILMLGETSDPVEAGSDSRAGSRGNSDDGLVSLFRNGPEVFPPSHPEGEGLTMADVEYYWSFSPDLDPSEVEVFPPTSGDEDSFTEQDLADLIANQEPEPLDTDLVPRDDEGHSVITLRDLKNLLRSAELEGQPLEVALWPADEDSGLSVTVPRELLIPDAQDHDSPENLADLFPPTE